MHPNKAQFWNRDIAYSQLSFDYFHSKSDFIHTEEVRWFISDQSLAHEVIDLYNREIDQSEAVFIHAVSLQGHSNCRVDKYNAGTPVDVLKAPTDADEKAIGALKDLAPAYVIWRMH